MGKEKEGKEFEVFRLVHVANVIDGIGKGHDTVIKALKELKRKRFNVEVRFVGDGPGVEEFKKLAIELGVIDSITFVGRISDKKQYMKFLRENDVLIFPSHSEGLPRVVIEAMACGLPCLASPVGGTPELLESWCLIDYNDYCTYAETIQCLIEDNELYKKTSARNISKAREYDRDVLTARRNDFYSRLLNLCR